MASRSLMEQEEVQCPLCLRYHNIPRRDDGNEEESITPSIGEVFGGTVKVLGAAGAVAMLLSRKEISNKLQQRESFSILPDLPMGSLETCTKGGISPNIAKIAMGTMILTGLVCTVWSWAYKQKIRKQKEDEFRGTLEICRECWSGIREALLNQDD